MKFRKKATPPGEGAKDPRDMVGQNPTGRERKASARTRGKKARGLDRMLKGTLWEKKAEDE
jgi:hypothetical protein